ncbi:hypothetical protein AAG906_003458 [Vitis piasezkii]
MSKRQFSLATNRSNCGFHFRARDALFLGRLLRISPNSHVPGRRRKDSIHNTTRPLLLQSHAIRTQKCWYDMKLNPSTCAFGVSAGKFLGFMVSQRGIEVSPDQEQEGATATHRQTRRIRALYSPLH